MACHKATQTDQSGYTQTVDMDMKVSPNAREKEAMVAEIGLCPLRHICVTCSLRINYTTHSQDTQALNALDVLLHEGTFVIHISNTPYHPSVYQWMQPILSNLMVKNGFRVQILIDDTHELSCRCTGPPALPIIPPLAQLLQRTLPHGQLLSVHLHLRWIPYAKCGEKLMGQLDSPRLAMEDCVKRGLETALFTRLAIRYPLCFKTSHHEELKDIAHDIPTIAKSLTNIIKRVQYKPKLMIDLETLDQTMRSARLVRHDADNGPSKTNDVLTAAVYVALTSEMRTA
ncbi:hypothetical protein BCR43DRAFT_518699 [Syncephalastrum racemosum]|uniref:Uncharacterized protein n=1 Tax=Syncephalastrum racemosum TaxID=13706 RepID=A0A1X2H2U9_SYNRA|nr:hypothetical protein BCR43DRAFT_518699 [Syncephalastrum racemosum]